MDNPNDPAFVMEPNDRFHCILVSEGVRYQSDPDLETILKFFCLRRQSGLCEIINVTKTFKADEVLTRNAQRKPGIPPDRIDAEVATLIGCFGAGIERETGIKMVWHRLDLGNVGSMEEQIGLIRDWGRVGVWWGRD